MQRAPVHAAGVGPFGADIHAEKVPPDRAIAGWAARQHRVIARWQLYELGLERGAIAHRVRTGRLFRIYPGVYAIGCANVDRFGRWYAAVLSCGPGAVLSHRDAAALYGIRDSARRAIDVTAPGRSRHTRNGITIHRPRLLHPDDCATWNRIPVTTVPRLMIDLAEVVSAHKVRRAFAEAARRGLVDMNAMRAALERANGRRGLRVVSAILADRVAPPEANAGIEEDFYDLVLELKLPLPLFNVAIPGTPYVVDALWPAIKLIIELDSRAHHDRTAEDFEYERVRFNDLQLAGYRVLRLTHHRIHRERDAVKRQLLDAYGAPLSARQVDGVAPTKS
jgi:hypothetical protein